MKLNIKRVELKCLECQPQVEDELQMKPRYLIPWNDNTISYTMEGKHDVLNHGTETHHVTM